MPTPNKCCNPLDKDKHERVYKNISKVTKYWKSPEFTPFIGKYICNSCRTRIFKPNVVISTKRIINNKNQSEVASSSVYDEPVSSTHCKIIYMK